MEYFLLLLILVGAIWFCTRKTPADYNIDKIKDGDTKDQVRSAFGQPSQVTKPDAFCAETWTYTIPFRLYVAIGFNSEGRVTSRYRSGEI